MHQPAVHLKPKCASMPGQFNLPIPPFAQHQSPPQINIQHEKQIPIAHSPHGIPPHPNPRANRPPQNPPQQLIISQPPLIPSSIPASAKNYLHVPNNPLQNTDNSP